MANNPYTNKVVYGNTTIMDITDTTAVASDVASGKDFYTASGAKAQGTLTFSTIYTGSSSPSSALGVDGDIYIQTLA